MRIGEVASKAGVNIQTIRFYERQRLLREPTRAASGYRSYDQTDLDSLLFIKWCQPLGFTLKEVKLLLELHTAIANLHSAHKSPKSKELQGIIRMAEEKLANTQEKIKLLQTMVKQLRSAIGSLQSEPEPVCPASKPRTASTKQN
jgi:MerR family mercuric resistance operon transcriptional regulator